MYHYSVGWSNVDFYERSIKMKSKIKKKQEDLEDEKQEAFKIEARKLLIGYKKEHLVEIMKGAENYVEFLKELMNKNPANLNKGN